MTESMNAQSAHDVRIPYMLTEAGVRLTGEMRAEHPPTTARASRRNRRWALTEAAVALLDSEADN